MALITSFATLVAAVKAEANRADMTDADAEGFIQRGEAQLNRLLRVKDMEALTTVSTNASGIASLPTGFLEMITVYDSDNAVVRAVSSDFLVQVPSDAPKVYALLAGSIYLKPAATETLSTLYFKKITALTSSNTTNWLLLAHPDVYLYAALLAYASWRDEDEEIAKWDAALSRAINEIVLADTANRTVTLMVPSDLPSGRYRAY